MIDKIPALKELSEMRTELKRELYLRQHVYPRWIKAGKLRQDTADVYNARLTKTLELVQYLINEAEQHRPQQLNLF